MALSLPQIETLQAIARAGSLVAAARAMHVTPAALTARLKALEEALGVALFDRLPNGLRPNAAGAIALEGAARIEDALRGFRERMEEVRTGRAGPLAVAAVSTAKYFAPRLIAAFAQSHPDLDLRLTIGNRDEIVALVRGYDVDLALMGRPPGDMAVAHIAIGPHPYVIVGPPGHRLAARRDAPKAELAGEAFLFREAGSGSRALFDYFIGDLIAQRARGMELGSNETIKQAVMAGLGIALLSAHTIAAEIADGRLVRLDIVGLPIVRQWYAVHRTDRALSAAGLAFRNFAAAQGGAFLPHAGLAEPRDVSEMD